MSTEIRESEEAEEISSHTEKFHSTDMQHMFIKSLL